MPWGARHPFPPLGRRPPTLDGFWPAPPPKGAYIVGGGRAATYSLGRLPPPLQHLSLSRRSSAKPCRRPATSTTTPSCCWIFINLSFPLAGSRRRRRLPSRTCVERGGAVRSALVIGDLDHVEYDYIITVLLNASVRDLQRYVDASNHSLLDELLDDLGETSRKFFVFCNVPQHAGVAGGPSPRP